MKALSRTKFFVPFDVELSFVYETYLCEENSVSHKNESFAAVAVMDVSECIYQKRMTCLGFLFLLPIVLSTLSSLFSLSLNQTHHSNLGFT